MNIKALLQNLERVSPALGKHPIPEILNHYWFGAHHITAFNGEFAIRVSSSNNPITGALPKILLDLLKSVDGEKVVFERNIKGCTVRWGKNSYRMDIMPPSAFVFKMPEFYSNVFSGGAQLSAFIDGLECCLCSVDTGASTSAPERTGITAIMHDGLLTMYSTNDHAMSRAKLPIDETLEGRAILPAAFCKQLVACRKQAKAIDISVDADFILADIGGAVLYGKLARSNNPLDYARIFQKHLGSGKGLRDIDEGVAEIINRVCAITGRQKKDKTVRLSVRDDRLSIQTDNLDEVVDTDHPDVSISCNPELLKRGLLQCSRWLITSQCVIMASLPEQTNLRYLISVKR